MKIRSNFEDSTLLAGWIFADLFLALTVIFLATVSYIPSGSNSNNLDSNKSILDGSQSNQTFNQNISSEKHVLLSNGFTNEYGVGEEENFLTDFNNYLKSRELPSDIKAVFIEIIGHAVDYNDQSDQGNLEAINFLIQIRKLQPANFDSVSSGINVSPQVSPNQVRIKVTF